MKNLHKLKKVSLILYINRSRITKFEHFTKIKTIRISLCINVYLQLSDLNFKTIHS